MGGDLTLNALIEDQDVLRRKDVNSTKHSKNVDVILLPPANQHTDQLILKKCQIIINFFIIKNISKSYLQTEEQLDISLDHSHMSKCFQKLLLRRLNRLIKFNNFIPSHQVG